MFLRRKYRDRMIGLIGAYAVLVAGIIFTGATDSAPAINPPTEVARPGNKKVDEASYTLLERPDVC